MRRAIRARMIACDAALVLLALTATLAAQSGSADSDTLKARIIAHARTVTAEDYAYTRTVRTETIQAEKTEERVVVERFDPSKSSAERWTLVSINGQAPDAAQLAGYRKELPKRRLAYYGRVADYFATPAATALDARGRTVFRFASLPKQSVMIGETDVSANSSGELIVDASGPLPFIAQARFTSTSATRVKLIAKIDSFESTTRYRLMPDGKPVPAELVSELVGSMLGREGRVRTQITYAEYRPVGRS